MTLSDWDYHGQREIDDGIDAAWLEQAQKEHSELYRKQFQRNLGMPVKPSREWLEKMADKEDALDAAKNQQEKIVKWREDSKVWQWHHNYGRYVIEPEEPINFGAPAEGARNVMTLTEDGICHWTQSRESKFFAECFEKLMRESSPFRSMFTNMKLSKKQEEQHFGEKITLKSRERKKERPNASYTPHKIFEGLHWYAPYLPLSVSSAGVVHDVSS